MISLPIPLVVGFLFLVIATWVRWVLRSIISTVKSSPNALVEEQAKNAGAMPRWVTPEGFTQLPRTMLEALDLGAGGGHVWFLKGSERWEAWREDDLQAVFGSTPMHEGRE